ncbi:hypothetical protein [Lyngbya aestuarii]|uniref:hypothetical protein n=1 Tax=Lyngbya aestuarii TaxID=118322 RepID=UPI00403D9B0A
MSACNNTPQDSNPRPTNEARTPETSQLPTSKPDQTLSQDNRETETVTPSAKGERKNYKPISLVEVAGNTEFLGKKPKEIALIAFGNTETLSEGLSQEVNVEYPQANQAIITIIQTGVADDSIGGIKYRVELQKTQSAKTGKHWEMVWAGSQYKCQSGRGHQDWSKELCS